ncbi:MAG: hypothetical protein HDS16_06855, partial [Bacteroides sp.]|nr:hypothetical protein [Bacteroides sp.]
FTQTWHATSLHWSGNFLFRRGAPRPYTRPVIFYSDVARHVPTLSTHTGYLEKVKNKCSSR